MITAKSNTECKIKDGTRVIADEAFYPCNNMTSVSIPNSVIIIGASAFYGCGSLTSINIPGSVTSIGNYAFYECTSLTNVNIPDGVTSIGSGAFGYCTSLTNINIPDSVTSISSSVCEGCGSLNIDVSPNNQNYCDIDGVLFTKDKKTIFAYAKDKIQPIYTIPDGVTRIGEEAFDSCQSLTSVSISNSVKSIGFSAFDGCENLTSITIPDSVTYIDWMAFRDCSSLTDVYYSGTEREWKLIMIEDDNDNLLNATIHYNSEMPVKTLEVQPVTPEVDTAANAVSFPVTVVDETRAAELNEVELYVAEYDENGCLTGLTLGTKGAVEGDTVTITADIPDADNYKFMLWDANNAPLMDAVYDIYAYTEQ